MIINLTSDELIHIDHALQHVMQDHHIDVPQSLIDKVIVAEKQQTDHKWPWTALCKRKNQ